MKFGEALSQGLVPEWKEQYVDYKAGKKYIRKASASRLAAEDLRSTDTTPLLHTRDDGRAYVSNGPQLPPAASQGPDDTSRRKGSLFNFSNKSNKDKRDQFNEDKTEFYKWLDAELEKVDTFYKLKEKEVYERFLILEDQFFHLKDHRGHMQKRVLSVASSKVPAGATVDSLAIKFRAWMLRLQKYEFPSLPSTAFLNKRKNKKLLKDTSLHLTDQDKKDNYDPNYIENQIRNGVIGFLESDVDDDLINPSEDERMTQVPENTPAQAKQQNRRDYTKKKSFGVPYLYAKRQLKGALVEHYRLIALLKSYRVMNRTAFRKITKKFDKAIGTNMCEEFLKRIDKQSYFLSSVVLDKILSRVEDLFMTYFDHDQHDKKLGLEKLKSTTYAYTSAEIRQPQHYLSTFLSGAFLGIGLPLFIIGLVVALDKTLSNQMSEGRFLLQLWGGFLLINLAFFFVGINLIVYDHFKISYKFIFEFNLANALDFKQFWLLPSLSFSLLGLIGWFSFKDFWPETFPGRTFPLIYLGIMLIIFLWPGTLLYGASRQWLQIALWRILWSGLYPVEFRDFYLGDILCSLTYPMGNISFFFCLYADKWKNVLGGGEVPSLTVRCGSGYSRPMGFLQSLPSIFRFLQCLRRFMDSGDAFPHLANMVKYMIGAVYYCLLSVWRIDRSSLNRAAFITFACINSIYTSAWDIVMDWSLGLTTSKNFLLRDHLFYKKKHYYYIATVLNVILRFQWIFYAFFSSQIQQLAVTSFCIALAEIFRRFVWMFFRMENEHCTNVILFRASRDSPLPYMILSKVESAIKRLVDMKYDEFKSSDDDYSPDSEGSEEAAAGVPPSISRKLAARTTALSRRLAKSDQLFDEEASIDSHKSDFHGPAKIGEALRRRSTLNAILNALNKAHIKDFQRKTYSVPVDDSDEEDDDDDDQKKVGTSNNHQSSR